MKSMALILVVVPAVLAAQRTVHRGTLGTGDRTLRAGEYADDYTFAGRAGQRVVVEMTSSAFDPYLVVKAPGGKQWDNDDFEGSSSRSRVEFDLPETGTWEVVATSYKKGETGAYEVVITLGGPGEGTPAGGAGGGGGGGGGTRVESGRLAQGDATLRSGEFFDEYSLQGRAKEQVVLDLRATGFDPYIILIAPGGKQFENDDHEGDSRRSQLSVELPEDGKYRILVTSYQKNEAGAYDLRIQQGAAAVAAGAEQGPRTERGQLGRGDDTLRSGEFYDRYTFEGRPGQRVTLDLSSRAFDPYLILLPPAGERKENDDVEGKPGHAIIETDLTEAGTYGVLVTSYQRGESGAYELALGLADAVSTGQRQRDVETIPYGGSATGRLEAGDAQLRAGEFRDLYVFEGAVGDDVVIELASSEFDPYLILQPPEGENIDNDDADGRQDLSRVELRLRQAGRYRIGVTSYKTGETGAYQLTLRRGAATTAARPAAPAPPGTAAAGPGRVHGVFVGISDYGGRASNLLYTADDARRVSQAMTQGARMRTEDAVTLTDRQATAANVRRAIQQAAQRAGPNDLFVFFYSGHGDRVERVGTQSADPDGKDETIELFDGAISDDEMAQLLSGVRARTSLIALDACFSGGFSKDVISEPGRMGLFSSEEDVTSGVAVKFRAGGYLAQFLAEGVGQRLADEDRDGSITALELSQYLHERYRADVKSTGADDYVRTGGPQTGYQHLVVDRGSVGPFDVLFR